MPHSDYFLNGKRIPSVTEIISILNKPFLVEWSNKLGLKGINVNEVLLESQEIGTDFHEAIANYFKKKLDISKIKPEVKEMLKKFLRWRKIKDIMPMLIEYPLISTRYEYGGCIDLVAVLEDDLTLLDFKTSKRIYPIYRLQLAGYWQLLSENGIEIKQAGIIKVPRASSSPIEEIYFRDLQQEMDYFIILAETYKKLLPFLDEIGLINQKNTQEASLEANFLFEV